MIGVYKPGVTNDLTLPSVVKEVLGGLGEQNVDIYVHSSGPKMNIESIRHEFRAWLPRRTLKALIVRSLDLQPLRLLDDPTEQEFWSRNRENGNVIWESRTVYVQQFERLKELYGLILAQELRNGERYSHMVRMRTDAIWINRWPSVLPVPEGQVAGPNFDRAGILRDSFWICSRETSWGMFYEAPFMLQMPWDRNDILRDTGCHQHMSESQHPGESKLSTTCRSAVFGEKSIWPEALLTAYLRKRFGPRLRNSCDFSGEFVVFANCNPVMRPCQEGRPANRTEQGKIEEVAMYIDDIL